MQSAALWGRAFRISSNIANCKAPPAQGTRRPTYFPVTFRLLPTDFPVDFLCSKLMSILHFRTFSRPVLDFWKPPAHAARNIMQIRRFQVPNSSTRNLQTSKSGAPDSDSSKHYAKSKLPGAKSNVLAPIVFRRPSGRLQNLILHASDAAKMQVEPQLADLNTRGRRSHAAGVFNKNANNQI